MLFDLDGTLTDPYDGIARSYAHAMAALGRPLPGDFDYTPCIGPPLRDAFATMLAGEPELVEPAVTAYRERYATIGLFENAVYDGVPAMLARLHGTFPLFVCTSKPHVYAERILARFALAGYFARVYGAELDGTRGDKRELLAWLLAREGIDGGDALLIGDRSYDVAAARANGAAVTGVLWGYGSPAELHHAGCTHTVAHPDAVTVAFITEAAKGTRRDGGDGRA